MEYVFVAFVTMWAAGPTDGEIAKAEPEAVYATQAECEKHAQFIRDKGAWSWCEPMQSK